MLAVDANLEDIARFKLPADAFGTHGIRPSLDLAVVSAESRVVAIDRDGMVLWEVHHPAWGGSDSERGSCWFSADGLYVWAHVPTSRGPDEWILIEGSTGALVGRVALACYSAGSSFIRHPNSNMVGLSVGEGQDGSETYFGRVEDGQPVVERLDDRTRVLVSFSPDGDYFLTTPHSEGPLQLHRLSDGAVITSLDAEAALDAGSGFDFYGGFVDLSFVLFTAAERDEVFLAGVPHLDNVQTVTLPLKRAGDPVEVIPGGFLTSDWMTGETALWQVSP